MKTRKSPKWDSMKSALHSIKFALLGVSVLCFVLDRQRSASANPSSRDPSRPMVLHGTIDGAVGLAKSVHNVCLETEEMIHELQAGIERGSRRPKHRAAKVLDQIGTLWKARRDASLCAVMGEPCGADLDQRSGYLFLPLKNVLMASNANNNELAKIKVQSIQRLTRGKKNLLRFLAKAKAAIASGKHMEVQKEMEAKGMDLYRDTFLLSSKERNPLIGDYFTVLSNCDKKVEAELTRRFGAIAGEKAQQELAQVEQFEQECQRVIGEIRQSKTATLAKSKTGDASAALDYLVSRWGAATTHVVKAYAMQYPFTHAGKSEARDSLEQLEGSAIPLLTRLIDTAAEVSTPEEIVALHPKLLASVATTARRIRYPGDFLSACQSSLDRMAQKNPPYFESVQQYTRATKEALRWRKEFSTQRSGFLATKTQKLSLLMSSDVDAKLAFRPAIRSRAVAPKKISPTWSMYPTSLLVQHVSKHALGKRVRDDPVVRPSSTLPICIVPYSANHYANILVPDSTKAALDDLENALFIDPSHPAIDLTASDAISSAKLHDYEKVAGIVKVVRVEGAITRFVKLSTGAYTLLPLGEIPGFSKDMDPLFDRCYRFDMEPVWVQHKYFTVGGEAK